MVLDRYARAKPRESFSFSVDDTFKVDVTNIQHGGQPLVLVSLRVLKTKWTRWTRAFRVMGNGSFLAQVVQDPIIFASRGAFEDQDVFQLRLEFTRVPKAG
jgi:hypothetical protein